jgi:tetratricopeptide (TPR) repeat protein
MRKTHLFGTSYFYALAIYYLELAWNKQLVPKVDQPLIAFQIAEMYRRLGTFDRALAWFKQADNIGGIEELNPYLKKQMNRAQEKDNRQFISSAHDSF